LRRKRRKGSLQSTNSFNWNFVSCRNSKRKQVKVKELQSKREKKAAPRKKGKKVKQRCEKNSELLASFEFLCKLYPLPI
jgi:hypothetical protein